MKKLLCTGCLLLASTASIASNNGRFEYSNIIQSDNMLAMQSFSLYSAIARGAGVEPYVGAELVWYKLQSDQQYYFNSRVFIGLASGYRLTPFIEVGTNLIDFLILNSADNNTCDPSPCDRDADVKAGLRFNMDERLSIGVFYQRLHFGRFQDILTGNHEIIGASVGLEF